MSASTMSGSEFATQGNGQWPQRLWLVDDNQSVRELLADLLGGHEAFLCARQFGSAEEAIEALAYETPPDIILTDLNMGGMSGIDAIAPMRSLAPETRVFVMTTFFDAVQAARAKSCGAAAFFLKSSPVEEMIEKLIRTPAPAQVWQNDNVGGSEFTTEASGQTSGAWVMRALNNVRALLNRKKVTGNVVAS